MNGKVGLFFMLFLIGVGVGYLIHYEMELSAEPKLPEEVLSISGDIVVIVRESNVYNRTLYLDVSQWYCRFSVLHGGSNPYPWDLAEANAPIVFFFLEDIEDPNKADNYSDLVIRMNPIVENGTRKMVLVFFAEGGYEKFVYHKGQLLHHYNDSDATSNYGIRIIEI